MVTHGTPAKEDSYIQEFYYRQPAKPVYQSTTRKIRPYSTTPIKLPVPDTKPVSMWR